MFYLGGVDKCAIRIFQIDYQICTKIGATDMHALCGVRENRRKDGPTCIMA
jgi:hypothetical protein